MARGIRHGDDTKAAVLAALLAGQSANAVARTYNLSKSTVSAWAGEARASSDGFEPKKRDEIGGLVADALRGYLVAISVLTGRTHDETWFREQSAADIAVLIGVLTDKAVRILEAVESAGSAEQ